MLADLRLARLDALRGLANRAVGEQTEGFVQDALDALTAGTRAQGGACFVLDAGLVLAATSTLERVDEPLIAALTGAAERGAGSRAFWLCDDVRSERHALVGSGELVARGWASLVALPVRSRRRALATIVLGFGPGDLLDGEGLDFASSLAAVLALTLDLGRKSAPGGPDAPLAHDARALAAAVARELGVPLGTLTMQLAEQRALLQQLELLVAGDATISELVAESAGLERDLEIAAGRVREVIDRWCGGQARSDFGAVDAERVGREALALARPHLERRGVQVDEAFAQATGALGSREDLVRAVVSLLAHASEGASLRRRSRFVLRTFTSESGVGIAVEEVGVAEGPASSRDAPQGSVSLRAAEHIVLAQNGHLETGCDDAGRRWFRLLLPLAARHASAPWGPDSARQSDPQAAQVMVVDDDPVFLRTARRALRPHAIRTAASASEAEIALLDPEYAPDLVLCDVVLPGVNGYVLHERVARTRPDIAERFSFITGGALSPTELAAIRATGCRLEYKPVDLREIARRLERSRSGSGTRAKVPGGKAEVG